MKSLRRFEIAIALAGLLAIGVVAYSLSLTRNTLNQLLPLIQISNDLKVKVSSSHLWFEEALHGDPSINLNTQVYGNIDEAIRLTGVQGSTIGNLNPQLFHTMSARLSELERQLRIWRAQTSERWRDRLTSQAGTASDAIYDASFIRILELCDENKDHINILVAGQTQTIGRLNIVFIVFLFVAFSALTAIFVKYRRAIDSKNRELQQARDMKVIGQIASGVAHEVRNPLNAILAITEAMFHDFSDQEEYSESLKHIRNQVGRLSSLMRDLLELGKPIPPSTMRIVSLPELCRSSIDLWKQYHPEFLRAGFTHRAF